MPGTGVNLGPPGPGAFCATLLALLARLLLPSASCKTLASLRKCSLNSAVVGLGPVLLSDLRVSRAVGSFL